MELLHLKRTTFYKLIKKYEQDTQWNVSLEQLGLEVPLMNLEKTENG